MLLKYEHEINSKKKLGVLIKDRKQGDNNYPDEIGPNSRNGTGMGFYS